MDNVMQTLATNLISSLKYLEQGVKDTNSGGREKSMIQILKVLELGMELSSKIISGLIYACLTLLSDKGIHETEVIALLRIFEILLKEYSSKPYFLPQTPDNMKIYSFLAKLVLDNLKVY
jgi:hypothetical protein